MTDYETLNEIFGAFYDAALGAVGWDEALTRFVNHSAPKGYDLGFVLWEAPGRPGADFVGSVNLADFAREIYIAQFAGINPWNRAVAGRRIGAIINTDEDCDQREFRESALYRSFLSNWNLTRALIGLLDRERDRYLGVVMAGEDGVDIADLQRNLRLALPHLQRATRVSRRIADAEGRAQTAEAALSKSHAAMFALGADLSVINANAAALGLIEQGVARRDGARLRLADRNAHAALAQFGANPAGGSVAFNVAADAGDLAALGIVMSASRSEALAGFASDAAMLLTLARKGRAPAIPVDHLAAWYGLTPTEARLAASLADGDTVSAVAQQRGVSENAVRYILKGVLKKSGASDQARLIAMLRALPVAR